MPLLSFAIPMVRSGAPLPFASNPPESAVGRDDFIIDIGVIKNQIRPMPLTPHETKSPIERGHMEHFRKAMFECRPTPIGAYFDNVLAELVTPKASSCIPTYDTNAALRTALKEILSLHPDAGDFSLKQHIGTLSLPSLLRDGPEYTPGTLTALCHDVGAHSVAIGRIRFTSPETPGDRELHFAGESELAFLHEGNPHAATIQEDHASILEFHYRAAGMKGDAFLQGGHDVGAVKNIGQLSDFTAHLARCRQRTDLVRGTRHRREAPTYWNPLDKMQTGPCVIL